MSSFLLYESVSNSDEENTPDMNMRRYIRDTSNPLELPIALFIRYFRVSKEGFKILLDELEENIPVTTRSTSVLPIIKLTACLRFFAEGTYQVGVGNDYNVGIAQPTFSKILKEVLDIFSSKLCPKLIKFPENESEKYTTKSYFYRNFGFSGIIGVVDGTHVKIAAPPKNIRGQYYNRKGYYSLNTMLICNEKMEIIYVDSRFPGSCHDSHVWKCSALDAILKENYNNGEINTWIIGDGGYELLTYLMTPYRSTDTTELGRRKEAFNKMHAKARNIIERTIVVLKNRFRCILGERQLHYYPDKCKKIINVCCALNNLCIQLNIPNYEEDLRTLELEEENVVPEIIESSENSLSMRIRDTLMNAMT